MTTQFGYRDTWGQGLEQAGRVEGAVSGSFPIPHQEKRRGKAIRKCQVVEQSWELTGLRAPGKTSPVAVCHRMTQTWHCSHACNTRWGRAGQLQHCSSPGNSQHCSSAGLGLLRIWHGIWKSGKYKNQRLATPPSLVTSLAFHWQQEFKINEQHRNIFIF